ATCSPGSSRACSDRDFRRSMPRRSAPGCTAAPATGSPRGADRRAWSRARWRRSFPPSAPRCAAFRAWSRAALRFRSRSGEETGRGARRLAEAIEAAEETRTVGLVIGLAGPLGAGKTEWVKGLAEGLGIEPDLVTSPTFVIASEYAGRRELVHADLYRL